MPPAVVGGGGIAPAEGLRIRADSPQTKGELSVAGKSVGEETPDVEYSA